MAPHPGVWVQEGQSDVADYSIGGGGSSNSLGLEQWRIPQIQHFPFLGGLESANSAASGLYSFDGEVVGGSFASGDVQNDSKPETGPGLITQMTAEKIEESDDSFTCLGSSSVCQETIGSCGAGGVTTGVPVAAMAAEDG
ncbi:hypothetical protein HPP92_003027 [Vanilla planifolia]|uniref:Uncharacterized protein n=1 Tax=Vanilla planifolia TaxID=51239 RepID=A0A835VJC9_VANPL|nr:hypothetical protein HPP92_003392 [Vanilla planifolia]KAG0502955.1 hypothetical protein HPP92_003027 [Vanilla planifolia]